MSSGRDFCPWKLCVLQYSVHHSLPASTPKVQYNERSPDLFIYLFIYCLPEIINVTITIGSMRQDSETNIIDRSSRMIFQICGHEQHDLYLVANTGGVAKGGGTLVHVPPSSYG